MDADRFDTFIRSHAARPSRRDVLAGVMSGVLARLPVAGGGEAAAAPTPARRRTRCKQGRRKCGKRCCPRGQTCLSNKSCAIPCSDANPCPAGCLGCGRPNAEGERHCILNPDSCTGFPTCAGTSGCPRDTQCQPCQEPTPLLCLPLCTA